MSLIVASGSNIGDSLNTLIKAKSKLCKDYDLIAESRVYTSPAVDYEHQPDFYNQVLEFKLPPTSPEFVMKHLLEIERHFGRNRQIPKGPRTLDLDIIFWGTSTFNSNDLIIPHPRWMERSFVVRPLQELPFFQTIEKCFTISKFFNVDASPLV